MKKPLEIFLVFHLGVLKEDTQHFVLPHFLSKVWFPQCISSLWTSLTHDTCGTKHFTDSETSGFKIAYRSYELK